VEANMVKDGRGITVRLLLAVGAVVAGLGYIVLRLWVDAGHGLPGASLGSAVLLLFMALGIYFAGLPVRRFQRGDSSKLLSPLRATRTLVLAQAAALTGALVVGWYAAQALVLLPNLDVASVREDGLKVLALILAGLALCVAGLLVQAMCRIDGGEHEDEDEDRDRERDA
jgi:hypothetical protein